MRFVVTTPSDGGNVRGVALSTEKQDINKEGALILANMWEYKDEKAFVKCQALFREAEGEFNKNVGIVQKIFPTRGIILHDVHFND